MSNWYEPKLKDVSITRESDTPSIADQYTELHIYLDPQKFYFDEGTNNYVFLKLSDIKQLIQKYENDEK